MSSGATAGIAGWSDGVLFKTPYAGAGASAYTHLGGTEANPVRYTVGGVHAGASAGSYTGVDANATIASMSHGSGEAKLALGIDTGVGVRNGTLEANVLGCGLKMGNDFGVNIFGSQLTWKNAGSGFVKSISSWF